MNSVGWVERSETHRHETVADGFLMGFAALNPSYSFFPLSLRAPSNRGGKR